MSDITDEVPLESATAGIRDGLPVIVWAGVTYIPEPSPGARAILEERATHPRRGYTAQHDAKLGTGHLVDEAVYRLTHMGETPSPEFVRHAFVQAGALIVAALDAFDA